MNRIKMMSLLREKWKVKFVSTTEEFNGSTDGIWMSGENGETNGDGFELFDYYNENYDQYEFGVHHTNKGMIFKSRVWADEKIYGNSLDDLWLVP